MRIAVLALQGAFEEHQKMLEALGVESFLVRNLSDWQKQKDGLIIPGGESTAMMRIMRDEGLYEPLRLSIVEGLPVFGTCAGLILLDRGHLHTMEITARRNAYGRQLGSFYTEESFRSIGKVPMTFIRAPYIESAGKEVTILSTVEGHIVAARQGNQLVTAFHPELNEDLRVHQYFLSIVRSTIGLPA